jgi:hypothetical protein
VGDDSMVGPGAHENAATEAVYEDVPRAQVYALLAIASAINRLADAIENRS